MVPVLSLWLPIVLSAILVFVVSSIIHMVLPFHRNDFRTFAKEDEVLGALRPLNIPPGDYAAPHAATPAAMREPAFVEKMTRGPVVLMTVVREGPPAIGTSLAIWFLFCLVVGVFAAYIGGRALGPGAHYLEVFRFAGAAAFMGYSLALAQQSIWYHRRWATTFKSMIDWCTRC